ncbi:MAG: transposase [archaeon]|nr:transposase [archaeon]
MKKLTKKVKQHARKHLELLKNYWSETNLTEGRANQIIVRIKKILKNVPAAIKQAHERIIGERHVKNSEKLLSLYETDTNVIVRGKASAEVEFGNKLIIGEINCGVIVDWELIREGSPADTKLFKKGLGRIEENYDGIDTVKKVVGDRGFPSKEIEKYLADKNIENYICPRSVLELRKQLENETFCYYQNRRSQTEGRIGILKNNFFGTALRSKGFESRELHIAWGILVHNLWVIARLPKSVALKEAA